MTAKVTQIQAKRNVAIDAVTRLIRVCSGHESEAWLGPYANIHKALIELRDADAIEMEKSARSRCSAHDLARSEVPKYVVSEELAEDVRKTIARLRMHMMYGDKRPTLTLCREDPEIERHGTRKQRFEKEKEAANQLFASIKHDPVEETARFMAVIDAVNSEAEAAARQRLLEFVRKEGLDLSEDVKAIPMTGPSLWSEKKRILKETYGIDWKTPSEMNPNVMFD